MLSFVLLFVLISSYDLLLCYLFWYQVLICCFGICFDINLWSVVLLLVLISSYGLLFCIFWYFYIKLIFVILVFFYINLWFVVKLFVLISSYDFFMSSNDLLFCYLFWFDLLFCYLFWYQVMICRPKLADVISWMPSYTELPEVRYAK